MSCEENRVRYLTAVCGPGPAGQVAAAELERLFQRERGTPATPVEAADNEAKTRLLFAQFARCAPPLRPPTHSASGLPKREAQRGYARLYDRLTGLAAAGALARCPACGQFGGEPGHHHCPAGAPAGSPPAQEAAPGPRRAYHYRTQEVAAEIAALPPVTDPAFVPQACAARQPETAAHAIRALLRQGAKEPARRVGDHLTTLVSRRLAGIAKTHFPQQPALREDLRQELAVQLWQELADLRPGQDFITYNFPCVINRLGADLAGRLGRPGQHERPLARGEQDDGSLWAEEDGLAAPERPPEAGVAAEEILAALEPRERTVAYLLAQGVPITSRDPHEVTVARLLGVTDRSVRNYRQNAARQLAAAGLAPPGWLAEARVRAAGAA
jgi:DNA-directed RNA polymerase specialized sigma24 family protein